MKTVQTLIAMARAKVHTDRQLAERIGIEPQTLNAMKKGHRAISPETVAALCDMLELPGDEAREWLAIAVIENPKNASKADWLRRALFACWVLGVSTHATQTNDAGEMTAASQTETRNIDCGYLSVTHSLYIVAHWLRFFVGWLSGGKTAKSRQQQRPRSTAGSAALGATPERTACVSGGWLRCYAP